MTEEWKYKFAKLKLVHYAGLYWRNVERTIRRQRDRPTANWRMMKLKLREEYLPSIYHQGLSNQRARDHDRYQRKPIYRKPEPTRISIPSQYPGPSQMRPNRPDPSPPLNHKAETSKI